MLTARHLLQNGSSSMSYPLNGVHPQQKLNFDPPRAQSNDSSPPRRHPTSQERHEQAESTIRQGQSRAAAGVDSSYLSPHKNGPRPLLNESRSGSEADSLLDLYGHPRNLPDKSIGESIDRDRIVPYERLYLEDEDPERSRWIHRDKLAIIESHEMREAGIKLPRQQPKTIGRSKSGQERNMSVEQASVPNTEADALVVKQQKKRRTLSPRRQVDEIADALPNEFDIRTPGEIAADNYLEANSPNAYKQQIDSRKSSSRIPLPRSSPMPIPQEHIERDTPLPRKRGASGNWGNGDEHSLAYPRMRSRNNSVGSAALFDDTEPSNSNIHTTPTPASRPRSRDFPPKTRTSSLRRPPTSNNRTPETSSGPKPRSISTSASPRTHSSGTNSPKSRSGLESRPATAINRPEGDAPWLATMYKPDPRLPPDEQILPTHAKRLQQEQWERAQKESEHRRRLKGDGGSGNNWDGGDREKASPQLPREFSPLAEHTINGIQPSSKEADEKTLQEGSEWPLTIATSPEKNDTLNHHGPNSQGMAGKDSDNSSPHAGYSPIPRVKQGGSPVNQVQGQRMVDPFERERALRGEKEKADDTKKDKGCGCCIVM